MENKKIEKQKIFFVIDKKTNIIKSFNTDKDKFIIILSNNKNFFYKKFSCRGIFGNTDKNNNYYPIPFNIDKLLILNTKSQTLNKSELETFKHNLNYGYNLRENTRINGNLEKIIQINLKKLVGNTTKNIHYQKLLNFSNVTIIKKYV